MQIQFNSMASYVNLADKSSRTRLQGVVSPYQKQLQGSLELKNKVNDLPDGDQFMVALDKLATGQTSETDVKVIQRFLFETTGANIGTRKFPNGDDGKFGPKTQAALQNFFEHYFTQPGVGVLESHHAVPQRRPAFLTSLPQGNAAVNVSFSTKGIPVPASRPKPRPATLSGPIPRPTPRPAHVPSKPTEEAALVSAGQPVVTGGAVYSRTANTINTWFVPQYDSSIKAARAADCGPATVGMILGANGFHGTNPGNVRRKFMGVKHNNATTSQELARGIEKGSGDKLDTTVTVGSKRFRGNPKAFLNHIRSELKAGRQVILLTKNMAHIQKGKAPSRVNGHYVVVQGVREDGSLVVADPGSRTYGKNRVFSYNTFEKAFKAREAQGMPNNTISVSR